MGHRGGGGAAALAGEIVVKVHARTRSGKAACVRLERGALPYPFSCPPFALARGIRTKHVQLSEQHFLEALASLHAVMPLP